ncbi:MAG: thioredoxin family protein [Opitutaceae bacterium]|nr:thioredoxin family protein [Opitutaceae bacterium]
MKTNLIRFLCAALAAVFTISTTAVAMETGKPAPGFTLTDNDGRVHSLADYRGKTVILEWVNPECPFVVKHYQSGNIPAMQRAATEAGHVWLVINSGHPGAQGVYTPEKVRAWQEANGSRPTAYLHDEEGVVGRLYGAKTTPHMYVITPDGTLVYNGAIDSIRSARIADIEKAENYVNSALEDLKAGRPVRTANTQAYGCSVKYR